MPYIGKSPHFGVRNRFVYVASSGATSVSGADANGATLTFTDGAFVDVYLNGVLLKPTTDYNTSTANTIAGLSALNTSDEVTVVVYDVFSVSDTVSATSGGTFSGATTHNGGITSTTGTFSGALSAKGGAVFNEDSADVDFRVESNGQANMFVVNGGTDRIGIMTNSPDANHAVHIQSGGYRSNDADSIGLLIGADIGATTFSDSTRKIGGISFAHYDTDEPNFNAIRCDSQSGTSVLTIGGTGETNAVETIQFNTASDDTDVSTMAERMKIKNDGDVIIASATGIGGVTPTNMLTVSASVNSYVSRFNNTVGSGNVFMHLWRMTTAPDDTTSMFLVCDDGNGTTSRMKINSEGDILTHDGTAVASISDERIKQDITDANSQWDDIKAVRFRNFRRKDDVRQYGDNAKVQLGLVAQEIEKTSPKLVKENPPDVGDILSSDEFGTLEDDKDSPKSYYKDGDTIPSGKKIGDVKEYNQKVKEQKTTVKSVIYSILYMKAVKALQEAMTRIETLETKVKALEDA